MELSNEFVVPTSVEDAWAVLTDVERIAPCMPGARLEEVDGEDYKGVVKVKVGPVTVEYKGTAKFLERDEVVKSALPTTFDAPGTTITYSYVVTNTGNVAIGDIKVNDGLTGLSSLSCPTPELAAGASETCTATYQTTQADVDAGNVVNTANVQGNLVRDFVKFDDQPASLSASKRWIISPSSAVKVVRRISSGVIRWRSSGLTKTKWPRWLLR